MTTALMGNVLRNEATRRGGRCVHYIPCWARGVNVWAMPGGVTAETLITTITASLSMLLLCIKLKQRVRQSRALCSASSCHRSRSVPVDGGKGGSRQAQRPSEPPLCFDFLNFSTKNKLFMLPRQVSQFEFIGGSRQQTQQNRNGVYMFVSRFQV